MEPTVGTCRALKRNTRPCGRQLLDQLLPLEWSFGGEFEMSHALHPFLASFLAGTRVPSRQQQGIARSELFELDCRSPLCRSVHWRGFFWSQPLVLCMFLVLATCQTWNVWKLKRAPEKIFRLASPGRSAFIYRIHTHAQLFLLNSLTLSSQNISNSWAKELCNTSVFFVGPF